MPSVRSFGAASSIRGLGSTPAAESVYPAQDANDRVVVLGRTAQGRRLKVVTDVVGSVVITVAGRDEEG
jgi:hypothetical protein